MGRFRLVRFGVIAVLASLVLSACQVQIITTTESEAEPEPQEDVRSVDIGVVLSLSGPNAAYGSPSRAGIELAMNDVVTGELESPVQFYSAFLDDAGDAQQGAEMFQRHVDSNVLAIFGPTLSNTAFEAHPVAQEGGIPTIAISNTAEGITETGEYIFRVSLAEPDVVPQTVAAAVEEFQPETAALIFSDDDAWSRSSAQSFRDAAAEHGIEIILEQDVPADGGDPVEAIAAVADADPDVILLTGLEHTSIATVIEAREHGLEQPIVCGNGCNTGTFIEATGDASEGLMVGSAWHIDVDSEQSRAFIDRYRAFHGSDPDQFSAQSYAGVQVLLEAIQNADSMTHDAIRDALAEIENLDTVLGTFSFDADRNGQHPAVIKVVQDGEFAVHR